MFIKLSTYLVYIENSVSIVAIQLYWLYVH